MSAPWKLALAGAAFLLTVALGAGTSSRPASADVEIDISVFYSSLAPHGDWVQVQSYGWAWVPDEVDYGWRPYTVGYWAWVDPFGWTWISEEPWGWATYHYGRWVYVEDYGWAWLPGTTWAPAWVVFRYGDPWIGWAPLPPETGWRYDAAPNPTVLNVSVNVGSYAWTFVPVRWFAEPDLRTRIAVTAYNDYLLPRTQWSTRYATVSGGIANQSIDVATVEKARKAPVPRRRLQEAAAPEKAFAGRAEGDAVVVYKPRVAAKPPANPPGPRAKDGGKGAQGLDLEAWTAQRRAALKAHLEAQKKALESPDALPLAPGEPKPGGPPPDDAAKQREAYLKALEAEQKRLEALLEQQRKRREQTVPPGQPPSQPPPPPKEGDGQGNQGKEKDHGKGKEKDPGMK